MSSRPVQWCVRYCQFDLTLFSVFLSDHEQWCVLRTWLKFAIHCQLDRTFISMSLCRAARCSDVFAVLPIRLNSINLVYVWPRAVMYTGKLIVICNPLPTGLKSNIDVSVSCRRCSDVCAVLPSWLNCISHVWVWPRVVMCVCWFANLIEICDPLPTELNAY